MRIELGKHEKVIETILERGAGEKKTRWEQQKAAELGDDEKEWGIEANWKNLKKLSTKKNAV